MGYPSAVDVVETTTTNDQGICDNSNSNSKPDSIIVDNIYNKLNDTEKEQTARASSYRYLKSSVNKPTINNNEVVRAKYAKSQIERYVLVEQKLYKSKSPDEWETLAYDKLKKTLVYREEKQIDDIRLCFDKDKLKQDDNNSVHATLRNLLTGRFANGASIIQGYTKDGQALFINYARADTKWDAESYIKGNIYMLERALACTERKSNGANDKVVVFYDYNGYRLKNSPPPLIVKELLTILYEHWPERLNGVYVVDAPIIFRAFWAIIKHFIDPITKELVHFVSGEEEKNIFREMISPDQASSFMYNGGQNGGDDITDNKDFFYDTPFDHANGEK